MKIINHWFDGCRYVELSELEVCMAAREYLEKRGVKEKLNPDWIEAG